jgi:hypothetical protein
MRERRSSGSRRKALRVRWTDGKCVIISFGHCSPCDSLIARTVLEPAPGYFLRLMPFSENSLVEDLPSGGEGNRTSLASDHLDGVMSRNGRNLDNHTASVREIKATSNRNFVN